MDSIQIKMLTLSSFHVFHEYSFSKAQSQSIQFILSWMDWVMIVDFLVEIFAFKFFLSSYFSFCHNPNHNMEGCSIWWDGLTPSPHPKIFEFPLPQKLLSPPEKSFLCTLRPIYQYLLIILTNKIREQYTSFCC